MTNSRCPSLPILSEVERFSMDNPLSKVFSENIAIMAGLDEKTNMLVVAWRPIKSSRCEREDIKVLTYLRQHNESASPSLTFSKDIFV